MAKYSKEELQSMLEEAEKKETKDDKYIYSESGTYSKKTLKMLFRDFRVFVIAVLFIFYKTESEPVVLIGAVAGFLTIEVWQLARIKLAETKEEDNES